MEKESLSISSLIAAKDSYTTDRERKEYIQLLRRAVTLQKMPTDDSLQEMTTRGRVWQMLMGVYSINTTEYLDECKKTDNSKWEKIYCDYDRTFNKDDLYKKRDGINKIVRLLNGLCNSLEQYNIKYLQGLNVLAGVFLSVMPEVDSYFCVKKLILELIPTYYGANGAIQGSLNATQLLDECLRIVDPTLFRHLHQVEFTPQLLLKCFISLSASTRPLEQALILWDYYFVNGFYNIVYITLAQVLMVRDILLSKENPASLFKELPPLQSKKLITIANACKQQIPYELQQRIKEHTVGGQSQGLPVRV